VGFYAPFVGGRVILECSRFLCPYKDPGVREFLRNIPQGCNYSTVQMTRRVCREWDVRAKSSYIRYPQAAMGQAPFMWLHSAGKLWRLMISLNQVRERYLSLIKVGQVYIDNRIIVETGVT
jgi:hypothetical protein